VLRADVEGVEPRLGHDGETEDVAGVLGKPDLLGRLRVRETGEPVPDLGVVVDGGRHRREGRPPGRDVELGELGQVVG
jgi:hypothetical protein